MLAFFLGCIIVGVVGGIIFAVFKSTVAVTAAAGSKDDPVHARIVNIKRGLANMVMFELDDSNRVELAVPQKTVGTIVVGDDGMLTYHKTVFKRFDRQTPCAHSDAEQ